MCNKRLDAIRPLHACIEMCLSSPSEQPYNGHQCHTKRNVQMLNRFLLASYVADKSESKDLLGIREGGQTKFSTIIVRFQMTTFIFVIYFSNGVS